MVRPGEEGRFDPRSPRRDPLIRGPLLVTPGDPAGVGPEVACRALARRIAEGRPCDAILVGDPDAIRDWSQREGLVEPRIHDPGSAVEPVEIAAIRWAVAEIRAGRAFALVTGPIHKGRLLARGFHHAGHTGFLGELCGVETPVMAFVGGPVRVALVTVHIPLRAVADHLAEDAIVQTIVTADRALRDQLGIVAPRIAVCGLNPHAGDDGALGHEDLAIIAPAIARARAAGAICDGPISAEGAFRRAIDGTADLVVAMYHDQGLAPLKALDRAAGRSSVNWTLGLPIIRTSVDHGTADDIAGKGIADAGGMLAALELAEQLAGQ